MELFYREQGSGQPLIILHGLFGSSDNWLSIAKTLSEDYHVYIVDQRNHGQSPNTPEFDYETFVEDLKNFIQEKGIENPIIIGHSMGGKVAMQFAAKYPEMLSKLVVVDISPRQYPIHHQTILEGLNAIDIDNLKGRGDADKALATYVPEMGVRMFLLKNLYRKPEGGFGWRINLPVITEKIGNVGQRLTTNGVIDVPSLFVGGKNSNYIQASDKEEINTLFRNVDIKMVDGAGHWIHAEQPEKFLSAVREFIG
ncbi:alpha/beta fold hydrolase [Limibacter armeniacum]|uniref:alpha/beta fold hydrolase n=1 Tax=Limibacter armeniacum TaxID=466084 RepID=UPI002FE5F224